MMKWFQSPWYVSVSAGLLLAASFPPFGIPIFIIPAFNLLFKLAEKAESGKQLAYWSYPGFVLWNAISTYWLMYATFAGGLAAILANAVLMTIPLALMRRVLLVKLERSIQLLLIPAIWTSYEFLHFRWELAWPWLSLGNAFADFPKLIQFIEFTGQLGITFTILLIATQVYLGIKDYNTIRALNSPLKNWLYQLESNPQARGAIQSTVWILLMIPGMLALSYFLYEDSSSYVELPHAEVSVLQPNFDSYLPDAGFTDMWLAQENLLQLADSARSDSTQLILYPENSIQPLIQLNDRFSQQFRDSAQAWNVTIVAGLNEYVTYNPEQAPSVFRGIRYGRPYDIFNSSMIWEADGTITPYRKYNLVPIVERMPFVEFFAWIDVFDWINWGSFVGFGKGNQVVNARFKHGKSSVLICYDSVFPDWSRKYVLEGATLLGVITNDGWWGNTPGHEQHFSFGRLRAIESRRSIARSANNGISGFILPNGEVLSRTKYWERTYLTQKIPLHSKLTFYVRFGDWLGWLSFLASSLFILYLRFKK